MNVFALKHSSTTAPRAGTALVIGSLCAAALVLNAQQPAQPSPSQPVPAASTPQPQNPPPQTGSSSTPGPSANADSDHKDKHGESGELTEDQLRQMLVGKQLFLRGAFLGDSLSFNEHGIPVGHPAAGSYTLSGVEIEKVHLTKHKVELTGARYGLHFLGALPYEDSSTAVERVKITPKKKVLKITIDRERVIKPKKSKGAKSKSAKPAQPGTGSVASSETDVVTAAQPAATGSVAATPEASATGQAQSKPAPELGEADTGQEPAGDQAADQATVTVTSSPAHAAQVLHQALDRVFATGLDDKLRAQLPDFWQLYYKAQAAKVDYRPQDASILRSNAVDQQAKVLSSIAPESNEYAQASGIAGPALYRVVIGTDGTLGEVAVERPIGFGLDENAVAAIRKATFAPAQKSGQPVAEVLDLTVVFRIYSKRTSAGAAEENKTPEPVRPGPYSVKKQ